MVYSNRNPNATEPGEPQFSNLSEFNPFSESTPKNLKKAYQSFYFEFQIDRARNNIWKINLEVKKITPPLHLGSSKFTSFTFVDRRLETAVTKLSFLFLSVLYLFRINTIKLSHTLTLTPKKKKKYKQIMYMGRRSPSRRL